MRLKKKERKRKASISKGLLPNPRVGLHDPHFQTYFQVECNKTKPHLLLCFWFKHLCMKCSIKYRKTSKK